MFFHNCRVAEVMRFCHVEVFNFNHSTTASYFCFKSKNHYQFLSAIDGLNCPTRLLKISKNLGWVVAPMHQSR